MSDRVALYRRLPLTDVDASWLAFAADAAPDRVTEFGAGTGRLTRGLARTGVTVVAIERDAAMAAELRRSFGDPTWGEPVGSVQVIEADVCSLADPPLAARVLAVASLLNEIHERGARRAALRTAARCLAPGGLLGLQLLGPHWLRGIDAPMHGELTPLEGGEPIEVTFTPGRLLDGRRHGRFTYVFPDGTVLLDEVVASVVDEAELAADLAAAGFEVVSGLEPSTDLAAGDAIDWALVAKRLATPVGSRTRAGS
jgi:SAM-dependent methyltransferase